MAFILGQSRVVVLDPLPLFAMILPSKSNLKRFANAKTFYEHLKLALEFCNNPRVLSENSPLAKPYFLYQHGLSMHSGSPQSTVDWGEVLCEQIKESAEELWDGILPESSKMLLQAVDEDPNKQANRYHFLVLELNFFNQIYTPPPKNQATIYNEVLHIGRTTHDRHLRDAVERLGEILLKRVRPTLRLESPTVLNVIVGRAKTAQRCVEHLLAHECVSLVGAGGIGKTVMGALIANEWPSRSTFWFTIRPNFNDQLRSLLFALGYFMHEQGSSSLWLQLVADKGDVKDHNLILGLALADLDALSHKPLIVIDEVDLLRSSGSNQENPNYRQILNFLEALQNEIALLLIGQRSVLESAVTLTLDVFRHKEIHDWLTALDISHTDDDLKRLESYTDGNPRLISLCISFYFMTHHDNNHTLADIIVRLPESPGIVPIWDRLRRRLSADEYRLMQFISIFRSPVPRDGLTQTFTSDLTENSLAMGGQSVDQLLTHQLLQMDESRSIFLIPTLQSIIYRETPIEIRDILHLQAAVVCSSRGEYTEAAYHLMMGGQPEQAIQFWFPYKNSEVERGQAEVALAIFEQISLQKIDEKARKKLALTRGSLCNLLGKPEKAIENLEQGQWEPHDRESISAFSIWGRALDYQGDSYAAHQKIEQGIQVAVNLLAESTILHVDNGLIYLRERDLHTARQEAQLARYNLEMLESAIHAEVGNYETALVHSHSALTIAGRLDDQQAKGRAHYYVAISYMHQNDFEQAFHHYNCGLQEYQAGGFKLAEAELRTNLAANYSAAGDYQTAIKEATEALSFFERIRSSYWSACNTNNIAEAYFELGNHKQAEAYAMQTMGYEEAHFFPYGLFTVGSVRRAQGKLDEAEKLYAQSCQVAEENEDRFMLAHAQRGLGQVYIDTGQKTEAAEKLQSSLALFQQMKIEIEVEKSQSMLDNLS